MELWDTFLQRRTIQNFSPPLFGKRFRLLKASSIVSLTDSRQERVTIIMNDFETKGHPESIKKWNVVPDLDMHCYPELLEDGGNGFETQI